MIGMSDYEAMLRGAWEYQAITFAYGTIEDMEEPEVLYLEYELTVANEKLESEDLPDGAKFILGEFECEFARS